MRNVVAWLPQQAVQPPKPVEKTNRPRSSLYAVERCGSRRVSIMVAAETESPGRLPVSVAAWLHIHRHVFRGQRFLYALLLSRPRFPFRQVPCSRKTSLSLVTP